MRIKRETILIILLERVGVMLCDNRHIECHSRQCLISRLIKEEETMTGLVFDHSSHVEVTS